MESTGCYIQQDPYLSKHRGQYAARNGATTPGVTQLDIRIMQDFFINVNGKRNTIQFTLDIFNFGNLLNPEWGVQQTPIRNQLLTFVGQETATGRPVFSFPLDGGQPLTQSFRNSLSLGSVWQAQFGVRYIFN